MVDRRVSSPFFTKVLFSNKNKPLVRISEYLQYLDARTTERLITIILPRHENTSKVALRHKKTKSDQSSLFTRKKSLDTSLFWRTTMTLASKLSLKQLNGYHDL